MINLWEIKLIKHETIRNIIPTIYIIMWMWKNKIYFFKIQIVEVVKCDLKKRKERNKGRGILRSSWQHHRMPAFLTWQTATSHFTLRTPRKSKTYPTHVAYHCTVVPWHVGFRSYFKNHQLIIVLYCYKIFNKL